MRTARELKLPRVPALSAPELARLIACSRSGDVAARDEITRRNLRLVMSVVQRFANRGVEDEDLFQIGCIGLLKAVDRFEPERGYCFSTFAVPMVVGEIQSYLRDEHPLKVGRSLKSMAAEIRRVQANLAGELGREPSLMEIAARSGISQDDLVFALDAVRLPVSLQEVLGDEEGTGMERGEQLADAADHTGVSVDNIALRQALQLLPERERAIVALRFFGEKTQAEVAKSFGLSQVQISRLERKALDRLRALFD